MSLGTQDRRRSVILGHINPEVTHSNAISSLTTNFTSAQAAAAPQAANAAAGVNHDAIVSYQLTPQGVAILAIKNPPVNALSDNVLFALEHQLNKGLADPKCKAFVVTSQIKGFFIAGADIAQIQKRQKSGGNFEQFIKQNTDFLNRFESAFKPSVAAIAGQCLGGGLEVAMGLNARVCTPNSSLGLPELNLGLIPGFGGTQRLPRLVGVQKGLEMMLTSTPVKGTQALKLGLVDDVVDEANLLKRASEIALELAEFKRPRKNALNSNKKIESPGMLAKIFQFAEAEAKKKPDLVQVQACINAVKAGLEYNGEYGLETERKEFLRCAASNTSQSLIHFFFASKATAKVPGISGNSNRQFKKIGVIGGGLMGSGIAASALMAGMSVHIKEVNEQFLNAGLDRVRGIFKSRLDKGRMTQQQFEDVCKRLSGSLDYSQFGQLDMVIEAALENLELKQKIFADLEKNCSPTCILASNTSTIDLLAIGANTKAQNRIIGLHYFSPAHVMKLLEIVRTEKTDPQIIVDSLQFSKLIQKTPVVVGNCPGFAVNRIFFDYNEGASFLIDRGVSPYKIDEVMKKFGMPMGVFRMGDMAGLDVAYHAGQTMYNAFKHRSYPPRLTAILVKNKRLGEKTGAGVYKYTKGKAEQDPEIQKYIAEARAEAGNPAPLTVTDEEIVEYIMFPTVNEACRVIEEGMVYRVADIDVAGIFGMGFPAYRGGLMKYAETVGAKKIYEKMSELYQKTGEKLFEPCDYLRKCAQENKTLYQL